MVSIIDKLRHNVTRHLQGLPSHGRNYGAVWCFVHGRKRLGTKKLKKNRTAAAEQRTRPTKALKESERVSHNIEGVSADHSAERGVSWVRDLGNLYGKTQFKVIRRTEWDSRGKNSIIPLDKAF